MKLFKILAHTFCMCLLSFSLNAKILKYDVYQSSKKEYSFKEVCKKQLNKDFPLIEEKSSFELDCMGKTIDVNTFCEKTQVYDPYLIRGFIKESKVYCQSARRVILKYECSKTSFCNDSSVSCFKLQAKLARRLKLVHHSLIKQSNTKILNCYFDRSLD